MSLYFKKMILIIAMAMVGGATVPSNAHAKINAGLGMEYYTVKLKVIDQEDRFFHTVLQSTVGVTSVKYEHDYFVIGMDAGWSDWNVSGEWYGTNLEYSSTDNLGWMAQQVYNIHAAIKPLPDWVIGCSYRERRIRHYAGDVDLTYLSYRTKNLDAFISYDWFRFQGITVFIGAAYSINGQIEIFQDTQIPISEHTVHRYDESGSINQWQGRFGMVYDDEMNWRLSLEYIAGVSEGHNFKEIKELSIAHGRLVGLLIIRF